ncbi:hypothetical protein T07_2702 [Trichinella nelsoni]|uniref:Uncharacterized protein n=1 Tax=Trichinella nelsoni TaxID=6336 RepID=A0A0V0SFV0_9BILA|nr:hypothetical protein T07_2702 [Trichinella nelsoni]
MLWEKHELEKRWQRSRLLSGSLHWGPVRGAVQVFTCGVCFCIRLEMDPTECLKKLEDFFCPSGVPTSNYGVVVRYLLSDPVRCELYLVGQARENSFEELKRELLNTYGPEKSSVQLIECIHALRQRKSQIIKQCAEEVAKLGRRTGLSESDLVALFAGGVASREVHRAIRLQEPPTLAESHKLAKKVGKAERHFQERQQPHTGVMKQEKDDVTQDLEALWL